jgi:hypothetical protein
MRLNGSMRGRGEGLFFSAGDQHLRGDAHASDCRCMVFYHTSNLLQLVQLFRADNAVTGVQQGGFLLRGRQNPVKAQQEPVIYFRVIT